MEKENKSMRYHHAVNVDVVKVILEENDRTQEIDRIRFITNIGDITFKPSYKEEKKVSSKDGFEVVKNESKKFTKESLIEEYPVLSKIAIASKKEPQNVVICYTEMKTLNEKDDVWMTYNFMMDWQFNLLYYAPYEKDNSKVVKMEEMRNKWKTMDVEL